MKLRLFVPLVVVAAGMLAVVPRPGYSQAQTERAPSPVPGTPAAEPAGPLTLGEAVARALEHFPTVRGAREEVSGARAALGEQKAAWWPSVKLAGSATRYEEPGIVYPIHAFSPGDFPPFSRTIYQGGLNASYTLYDGGGRIARVREATRQRDAAGAALEGAEAELIAQVAAKYVEILSRREVVRAHESKLAALASERERVVKFLAAGKAARVDSLRVEAALASARAEGVRLSADLALSERDLTGLTGIPRDRTRAENLAATALADTSVAPADDAVTNALAANADVREAGARVSAASAGVSAARGARWPQLSLTGNYQVWSDPDGNSTGEWNAGLQLTQSLFTGGAVSSRVAQRAAASRRAEEALRLARIQTGRATQAAHDRVREAAASARSLRAAVASYEEVARIEALALSAGSGTQSDFLNAQADLMNARAALAEAARAEVAARLELARLTGELSPEWVARHLEARP